MNILAIGAHPDDIELACAGTLLKYARQGHTVSILHACTGDKGDFVTPPDELARIRVAEAARSGARNGFTVECLGFPDAGIFYNEENLGLFVDAMRKYSPDVIFTHNPEDYHLDHIAVSKLVTDASFLLTVPHYRPHSGYCENSPLLYYFEPYGGFGFVPTDFVDISDFISEKIEMMKCHESQLVWMKEHDHVDILDYILTFGKHHGYQCGAGYAEVFRRYFGALRASAGNILP